MVDGIDNKDKKVSGIGKTNNLDQIHKSESIAHVNKTGKVGAVNAISGTSRTPTREMSFQEREELLRMVGEEAEKLFSKSKIPASQREAIEMAVKQTIDAALIEEQEDSENPKKP